MEVVQRGVKQELTLFSYYFYPLVLTLFLKKLYNLSAGMGDEGLLLTVKSIEPELILACQVGPSFKTNPDLEISLQQILETSVQSFGFWRAVFVLVREGKAPVWWHAENKLIPKDKLKKGHWITLQDNLNRPDDVADNMLLDPLNPTAFTTLPVILQVDNPVGTMEVGIFNTDPNTAEYMLIKALSLGRHMADIIQESLFGLGKNHKFRNVAAWMEMISTISSTLDIRQVLHVVAQLTADLFLARSCILMLDENDHTLIPAVAVGSYDNKLKEKFKALKNYPPFKAITMAIKTQRCQGRGEMVTPLPALPSAGVLLVKPCFGVSTADVYRRYDTLAKPGHPDVSKMLTAVINADMSGVAKNLGNALEDVTLALHPEIGLIKEEIAATGATGVLMSGSGPTVFGLYADPPAAVRASGMIKRENRWVQTAAFYF